MAIPTLRYPTHRIHIARFIHPMGKDTVRMHRITVRDQRDDETFRNQMIDLFTERLTLRELIRAYVYQHVRDMIAAAMRQPANPARRLNWTAEYEKALTGFSNNEYVVLVEGRQVESLDEELTLKLDSPVTFVRLTPLVGGSHT